MYLLCADGSGQTRINLNRQNNGLYILSGVIVHESDWNTIEEAVAAAKKELFPYVDPEDLELHAYSIWNNSGFFADKKLNIDLEKKHEIFSTVLDLICRSKVTLINAVIVKDRMKHLYNALNPMEHS